MADSIALSRAMGYVRFAQHQADMERLLVQMVQAGVPREQLEELFPGQLEGLDGDLLGRVRLSERLVPDSVRWRVGCRGRWRPTTGRSPGDAQPPAGPGV
jgi:penicillin amidase